MKRNLIKNVVEEVLLLMDDSINKMNNRLSWLDNLKGYLILLVVLGHTIQFTTIEAKEIMVFNYIHSFHVPLFMLTSGYAFGLSMRRGLNLIKRRFFQLMVPYFVWSLLWLIFIEPTDVYGIFLHPESYLWFAWALFFISVIHMFSLWISNIIKIREDYFTLALAVLIMLVLSKIKIQYFAFNLIGLHFFFYIIGVFMCKIKRPWGNTIFLSLVGILSLGLSFTFIFGEVPSFSPIKNYMVYMILVGIIAALFYLPLFCNCFDTECFLTKIGKHYTLGIYFIHLTIIKIVSAKMDIHLGEGVQYATMIFCSWIVITTLSIALAKLFLLNKVASKSFLGV